MTRQTPDTKPAPKKFDDILTPRYGDIGISAVVAALHVGKTGPTIKPETPKSTLSSILRELAA